jgi:hypothetical protein
MPYRSLENIAEDIKALLEATEAFETVETRAVSSGEQLFDAVSNIRKTPAAFVLLGDGSYDRNGLVRTFSPVIVVLAEYKSAGERRAAGVWALLEAAQGPFEPVLEEGQPPVFPGVNGVGYELKGWSPVGGTGSIAAYALELEATETFKRPSTT